MGFAARPSEPATAGARDAVAVVDGWRDDPVLAIRTAVDRGSRRLPAHGAAAAGAAARGRLAVWADVLDGELYLVLDQLEEYFLYPRATRRTRSLDSYRSRTQPGLPVMCWSR